MVPWCPTARAAKRHAHGHPAQTCQKQHYTACVSSVHVARALAGDAVVYVAMRDKLDLLCKFNSVGIDAGRT